MADNRVDRIMVSYSKGQDTIPVGRLAFKDRTIFFEYAPDFLKTGLELSPFKLPLKAGVFSCNDRVFEGLFGVFNDSLPDGWGRLLLDRKLMKLGLNANEQSPLDRLRYVGRHGMGALIYEPEIAGSAPRQQDDLDQIAEECFQFYEHDDEQYVDDLLAMNGSSAGARPKIVVKIHSELTTPHQDWMIKFSSSMDPKDIGSIEYAYHLMAKASGLDLPESRLFKSKKCSGYFGVKRFDRRHTLGVDERFHMHTVSGLLHADHRIPSLDYETIMKATMWLTKDIRECEKQFRHAVFNVLSHNRDDHAKNFSFLMDAAGHWRVSPAYDLTFSSGPAGEHCTTIMGEGKKPALSHLMQLAQVGNVNKNNALSIIDEVKYAISKWRDFAHEACVTKSSLMRIDTALRSTI